MFIRRKTDVKNKRRILLYMAMMCLCLNCLFSGCSDVNTGESGYSSASEITDSSVIEPDVLTEVKLNVAENIYSAKAKDKVFRANGRTFKRNGGLACDFTCTGISFNAICKGEVQVSIQTTNDAYFTVFIDGKRVEERFFIAAEDSGRFITIANFADYGKREIVLAKQSQYAMAYCEIAEVKFMGSFGERPKEKPRFIEFYGDSIMNGSNIYTGGTSTKTSDGTLAYSYLTAGNLNADCNIIGRGGMGLYATSNLSEGMNDIWDLCGSTASPGVTEYDFGRMPDCVVVALGINDSISANYSSARYAESVEEMIFNLRSVYGEDIRIVWCYDYHVQLKKTWNVAKEKLDGLNGNGSILFCALPNCALSKDQGGDGYHPDVKIAAEIADTLTAFIEKNIY